MEVFDGNTGDPTTLAPQTSRVRQRFGLQRVVVVGDRGMLTEARLREDLAPAHLDWITALRAPQVRQLVGAGALQLSLFDQRDLHDAASGVLPRPNYGLAMNAAMRSAGTEGREGDALPAPSSAYPLDMV